MTNDLHPLQRGYQLRQDAFGNLDLVWSDGQVVERVTPVRAFPFSDPEQGLSLVDTEGHEVLWLDSINQLTSADRALVDDVLAGDGGHGRLLRLAARGLQRFPRRGAQLLAGHPRPAGHQGTGQARADRGGRVHHLDP